MQQDMKELLRQYYDVFFAMGAVYDRIAQKHGITSSMLFVLQIIYEFPDECTQRFICEKLFYPKQTVNTMLTSLEKNGYVIKKVSPHDKRSKIISLTDAGKAYTGKIINEMTYLEESAFLKMSVDEINAMLQGEYAYLKHLTEALDSLD
jgi:DNA-binding MarR family transcriptional regulator